MIYRFGDFELDAGLYELRRAGAPVAAQPKVLALLFHLVRERERTVPKEDLFAALWPGERVGETSLTRAVRGARRALGDDGDAQTAIRSVRGVGYRFVLPVEERDGAADAIPADAMAPTPLVGREAVLARLEARLDETLAGRGGLVLLIGPPGIGKTRLADELAARARTRGAEVLVGRCYEGDGAPPFWPWLQVVRGYAGGREAGALAEALGAGAADLAQAMPALAEQLPGLASPPAIAPGQLRFRLHDSMAAFLARAAAARPLVVVLDDLQQADLPSLRLLHYLVRELARTRVLFVGTRRDAVSLDADRRAALDELGRIGPDVCCELTGLEPAAVARFVALAAGAEPTPAAAAALHERTGGNPLFLGALLALDDRGDDGAPGRPPARGLEAAIERHLEGLSPRCRAAIRAGAVLGREFSLPPLARMLEQPPARVLEDLGAAAWARVVAPLDASATRWRFSHGLIPEVVYGGLAPGERVAMHARAGEALAAHYAGDEAPHLAELAHHFARAAPAGDVERAIHYATRAAERALAQTAWEEAAGLWDRVLGLLELAGADAERRVDALLAAAAAWQWASDAERARARELRALEIARLVGSSRLFARAALGSRPEEETGQVDAQRVALFEEALRRLGPGDDRLRVHLLSRLASALYFAEPAARHIEVCREAVAMARRLGDRSALGSALFKLHFSRLDPDGLGERARIAEELASVVAETGDPDLRARSLMTRIVDACEHGDRPGLDAALEAHATLAAQTRHPTLLWHVRLWRAMNALLSGRIAEADALAHEALREGMRLSQEIAFEWFGVQVYQIRREQERALELEPAIRRLASLYPAIATWPASLALLEAEHGREDDARRRVRPLCGGAEVRLRRDVNTLITLAVLAEVCWTLDDAALAAPVEAALAPYAGRQVVIGVAAAGYGAVDRYLGLLAATLGRREEAIQRLEAGRLSDLAMGAAGFAGHGGVELARVLLGRGADGDRERALSLVAEARATGERLGNARLARRAGALEAELRGAIPLRRRDRNPRGGRAPR